VVRAATEAFVFSFIAILFLDFVIGTCWNNTDNAFHPVARGIW
jgi:phospholipid/cholesterol/gamma-HCH transport system permease protein